MVSLREFVCFAVCQVVQASNGGSYVELYQQDNLGGSMQLVEDSQDVAEGTSSVKVVGPALWHGFQGAAFTGKRLLLKEGVYNMNDLEPVGDGQIISIKKLSSRCENRPVGVQSRRLIPDSWMAPYNNVEDRPYSEARLYHGEDPLAGAVGYGWTHSDSSEPGVQVYLGGLYRIWAVATQGSCWCDLTQFHVSYYASTYKLAFSLDGANYQVYQEEGVDKIFYGNNAEAWNDVVKSTLSKPVVANYVRLIATSGYYYGLRMEYYGCEALVLNTTSYDGVYPAPDMLSLLDGSLESHIVAPPSGQLKMHVATGEFLSLTVDISMKIAAPCTPTDTVFKMFTPLESVSKFKVCDSEPLTVSGEVYTWRFTCTCSPGNCDVVEIRGFDLPSVHCALLCDIAHIQTINVE